MKVDVDEGSSSARLQHQHPRAATTTADAAVAPIGGGRARPELRTPVSLLQLQRLAGNAAVVSRLCDPTTATPVQRACACGGGKEGDGECKCG